MTVKQWVTVTGIAASAAIIITFVWSFDRARSGDFKNLGAVQEKFQECCDRVDSLAASVKAEQHQQDEDGHATVARVTSLEARAEWNSRRIDGLQARQEDILKELGIIEGKVDQILQRRGQ